MQFSKYHGCGNSFILGVYEPGYDYSDIAKKVCDKNIGVGADGLILAKGERPVEMVFYNADGSRAPMCGNGIRCLAAFLKDHNLEKGKTLEINTLSGLRTIEIKNDLYEVNMGKPLYDENILDIAKDCKKRYTDIKNEVTEVYKNKSYKCNAVYMTTHHLVIEVDDLNIDDEVGHYFATHKDFQKGINVNFVKRVDDKNITIRTYERGVGWTKACGSGASASFVVLYNKNKVSNEVKVSLEYGELEISFDKEGNVIMLGPAEHILKDFCLNL